MQIEIKPPSRSWINGITAKINFHLTNCRLIDAKRFHGCAFEIIDEYFRKFETIFRETPEELFFVGDETMMVPNKPLKVLVPPDIMQYFEPTPPEPAHITAFCVNNLMAVKPPLFVILTDLKKVPQELKKFADSGKVWFASSSSGWMDRHLFLVWSINFINWLTHYRNTLSANIASKPAVLLLDGHTSRECPAALHLFYTANIRCIILPSHCTHVLQLFDVALAAPLKRRFTNLFNDYIKDKKFVIERNSAATLRNVVMHALTEAWDAVCVISNVTAGAAETGINPFNRGVVRSSPYVRDFTAEERAIYQQHLARMRNRVTISNCCVTDIDKIDEIRTSLMARNEWRIICQKFVIPDGFDINTVYFHYSYNIIKSINQGSSRLLSTIYPFLNVRYPSP